MNNYNYIPHTSEDRQQMLQSIGVKAQEDLFKSIPETMKNVGLLIPEAFSELELQNRLLELAQKNVCPGEYISFLGAGCYNRYVPSIVDHILSRVEFLTAYTPYQPEISQGTLQYIYEYQSMMCILTGMDTANASMYDGATATAEAVLMSSRINKKSKALISKTVDPEYQQVIATYLQGTEIDITTIPMDTDGITDLDSLKNTISKDTSCVVIQMPNFLGNLEEVKKIEQITHEAGALFVVIIDPISIGLLKQPGNYGADIAVGNGQSLGCGMMFGGSTFGFMACKEKYMRQLPGRIVGMTEDNKGNRAFTLTLQTREQHIRREKATSNICSNSSLNALASCVYLSVIGPQGLKEIANSSFQRAHFLANKIATIPGFKIAFNNFFSEFVILLPNKLDAESFIEEMKALRILPGFSIGKYYDELPNAILVSVTEKNLPVDLYLFISSLREFSKKLDLESVGI